MKTNKRAHILELCSEDAHNSWMFWQSQVKTQKECVEILQTVSRLVEEKKLVSLKHDAKRAFIEVPFDKIRFEKEVRQSMISDIGSDDLYWFEATSAGKEEDAFRRATKHR